MSYVPTDPAGLMGVILLAAGASSRMGKPKMLLPWGKTSVIGHLIDRWKRLGAKQIIVVTSGDPKMGSELDRLAFPMKDRVINPVSEMGMFSSILCAARWPEWTPDLDRWVIALGDQPHLRLETLSQLLDFSSQHKDKVVQPSFEGRSRHPVILPAAQFRMLASSNEETLKLFLAGHSENRVFCEIDDPGLNLDLDYPEDYERALELERRRLTE